MVSGQGIKTMTDLIAKISALPMVAKVSPWDGRVYVNLDGYSARAHGDRTHKIWVKGNKIVIEEGKGLTSPAFAASHKDFLAAIAEMGATSAAPFGKVRGPSTYTIA